VWSQEWDAPIALRTVETSIGTQARTSRWTEILECLGVRRRRLKMKASQRKKSSDPSRRADQNFAVATIALMIFFLVAGVSGWVFGNPGVAPPSQTGASR
jgi:hypothetical protein